MWLIHSLPGYYFLKSKALVHIRLGDVGHLGLFFIFLRFICNSAINKEPVSKTFIIYYHGSNCNLKLGGVALRILEGEFWRLLNAPS